jgi:hypothetical protein
MAVAVAADGRLAAARADASGTGPAWVGIASGVDGLVGFNGRARVLRESPAGTLAAGTLLYLSTSVPGAVTPTATTAAGTWRVPVGVAAEPSQDGAADVLLVLRYEPPFAVS